MTPVSPAAARSGRGRAGRPPARRGRRAARVRRRRCPAGGRPGASELAEALDAPVVTSFNGKGILPPGHPLHAGSYLEEPATRRLIEESDVCVALGTRFAEEYTSHWVVPLPGGASIQVDLNAGRIGAQLPGAPRGSWPTSGCSAMRCWPTAPKAGGRDGEGAVRAALSARRADVAARRIRGRARADAPAGHRASRRRAGGGRHDHPRPTGRCCYLDARRPGGLSYPMSGALGSAIPSSLGVAAANPGSPAVALVGDGGFLMARPRARHGTAERAATSRWCWSTTPASACSATTRWRRSAGRCRSSSTPPTSSGWPAAYGVGYRRASSAADVGPALRDAIAALAERSTIIELQAELAVPPSRSEGGAARNRERGTGTEPGSVAGSFARSDNDARGGRRRRGRQVCRSRGERVPSGRSGTRSGTRFPSAGPSSQR